MDEKRFDGVTKIMGTRTNRRAALRQVGVAGIAAGLLTTAGRFHAGVAATHASTPVSTTDSAPVMTPFRATVRQGPSAGTDYLGFLALYVDDNGGATGGFVTTEEAAIPVTGQVTGQSVSLLFTPTDDAHIYGVGVSDQPLVGLHGFTPVVMGGPLVGPGEGDIGDWAVPNALVVGGRRSGVCKSCLQSCRNGFGFGLEPPEQGVCRDICLQFGDAGYGGCTPADFG